MMANQDAKESKDMPTRLVTHYVKSQFFRVVHADGLFGGVTPRASIHMAFWSERNAIPQQMEYEIKPDRTVGEEVPNTRLGKSGIVREVDVDVVMDLATAIAFRKWMDEKIALLQDALQDRRETHE